jgi:hypothetical protein
MRRTLFAMVMVFALAALGCGKSESGTSSEGSAKPAGGEKAAGGASTITLDKLGGLKADVPAGAKAGDAMVGEGVMIQGPDLVVTIETASETRPKTAEDAKKEADMYSPKNVYVENLADGWALTYENEGGMGKNYFVQVRRDVGGKAIWCETTASTTKQQQNALATCKSIKP